MTDETPTQDHPIYSSITNGNSIQEAIWDGRDARLSRLIVDVVTERFSEVLDSLESDNPYLVSPLRALTVTVSERTASIATDNVKVFLNTAWWTTKSLRELRHCAAFTALTIIHDSINRGKAISDVDHQRWVLACNLVINRALIDEGMDKIFGDSGMFGKVFGKGKRHD